HRILLIVDGRGGAGQVEDLVDLHVERKGHVVADELETRMRMQVFDVSLAASEQVVHAQYFMAGGEKTVAEMRAQEPGTAGDENTFSLLVVAHDALLVQRGP